MPRKKIRIVPLTHNFQKYGLPLYSADWVWYKLPDPDPDPDPDPSTSDEVSNAKSKSKSAQKSYIVLAGGGGEGRSGIPNAVLLVEFDFTAKSLSKNPVSKFVTDSDLPYRMAVHPRGDGVVCSFPKSCRLYVIDEEKSEEIKKLVLNRSDKELTRLEDVGQQLALKFNNEGSALAAGGEDGNLRVIKWPSMEVILDKAGAHKSVKDVDFSPDGKYLVSLGNSGPATVWDVTSKIAVASLSKENDEVFCFCRFSESNDMNQVLYIAAVTGKGGSIVTWDTKTWKRMGSKTVVRDTISAFSVSPDGKLLACGTTQGDIFILNSSSKQVQTIVRKAHLGFVTALSFAHDSRALASISLDSSARVTLFEEEDKIGGLSLWAIVLVLLLAVVVYFMMSQGILKRLQFLRSF
ncbi:SEC12-like protein 2 [Castanea sativa]|uniref:SEC12-like protein 2 n=1 Tax=Castanea sativa TaxID=21020 RepID=UPI003F6506F2